MNAKCIIKRILPIVLLLCMFAPSALADLELPYTPYTYDYWGDIRYTPAAYAPVATVDGAGLSYDGAPIGAFASPQDICRAPGGAFYLADTGNNRIVVLTEDMMAVTNVIDGFAAADGAWQTFNAPTGVAVTPNGEVYIADSQNRRIVALHPDGTLYKIVENPQSEALEEGYVFTPLKVAVDYAGRHLLHRAEDVRGHYGVRYRRPVHRLLRHDRGKNQPVGEVLAAHRHQGGAFQAEALHSHGVHRH